MRKIIGIGIVLLMLVSSFGFCFATDFPTSTDGEIVLKNVATRNVLSTVSVTGGNASYMVSAKPNTSTSISYINATLKLVNSSGTVVKATTQKVYAVGDTFKLTDRKSTLVRGTYYAEYTLKVYKGSALVETITGKSVSVKY